MSRASKLTLLGTSLFAASTVVFVHFQQTFEKEVCARIRFTVWWVIIFLTCRWKAMHQGVVRDMEQQRIKRERQLDFDMQKALEEEYKKGQTVSQSAIDIPDKVLPTPVTAVRNYAELEQARWDGWMAPDDRGHLTGLDADDDEADEPPPH